MKSKNIWTRLATLGPIGYLSAPGTVATFITLPVMYMVHHAVSSAHYIGVVGLCACVCLFIVHKSLGIFNQEDDPSEIILDEVVGCLLTFWAIPLTTQSMLVGFILFRVLDILKFGLVKRAEKLTNAWGVMADDIVAAAIANIILRMLY